MPVANILYRGEIMYKFLQDFFCLFSILLQAYFSRAVWSLDCECGKPSDFIVSMRIVGGRRAVPHSYPWMVAIQKNGRMHCGGAIITDRHVLSAGHCFKWDNKDMMEALIGLDKLDDMKNVEKRNISKVVIHERFTSTTMRDENDIAVATLARPVSFGFTITPVCLPTRHSYEQWSATIAGWGRQGESTAPSRVLLKATVQILSDRECMESKLAEHLVPTMMCAFSKGKDGCQGDSGGPLVVYEPSGRFVQAGIVSWGIGCADSRYPGVYTRVSDYIDWIKEKSADGVVCDS